MGAREVELISDRDLARKRLAIFAGMDIPSTIVRKEILDNELDVVNERGQKATECCIKIGPTRMVAMDNGNGISTELKEGTDKTHLWIACAKMFSSSNYSGVQDSVGANGVGLTIANYTSRRFTIAVVNKGLVKGYSFVDGFLCGTDECMMNVREHPKMFDDIDIAMSRNRGDMVKEPLPLEEAVVNGMDPYYSSGFMVDAMWFPGGPQNPMFPDSLSIPWLVNYLKVRVGELQSGDVHVYIYDNDDLKEDHLKQQHHWTKDLDKAVVRDGEQLPHANDMVYIPSWQERVDEAGAVTVKDGPWQIALATNPMHVESVVQGAPIVSRYEHSIAIQIQEYEVRVNVPCSIKYLSKDYPNYQDQTKTAVRFPYTQVSRAFEKSDEVYRFFYREAEKAYMAKVISDSDSSMFWPALGDAENAELIIAEGYSAISGLKSQRDPMTQACIALRGKILNCWNLEMQKAMRSDVVKQILNAVLNNKYKRVVIATDEDPDGAHIRGLLLATFARFTNLIQDGKVYFVHTPHYLFKKRGKELMWGDDAGLCPVGYHVTTLKGLGGLSAEEVERFVMNPDTRELIQCQWDAKAWESLDHAFSYGGENWIA